MNSSKEHLASGAIDFEIGASIGTPIGTITGIIGVPLCRAFDFPGEFFLD